MGIENQRASERGPFAPAEEFSQFFEREGSRDLPLFLRYLVATRDYYSIGGGSSDAQAPEKIKAVELLVADLTSKNPGWKQTLIDKSIPRVEAILHKDSGPALAEAEVAQA